MRLFVSVLILAATACAVPRARRQVVEEETSYCNNGIDVCVPYYLCDDGIVNTDGSNLIDIR